MQGAGADLDTSEDCLYLNVWTAADSEEDRQPVMIFIHGGALTGGAGSEPRYDGEALTRHGVVVVTINYRLGPFGFFAHPELTAESEDRTSGNYGFLDAVAALEWVKQNIGAFGGDPDNVTVFGESAGARMAGALVGSPAARGLFHRAILQSGTWMGLGMSLMPTLAAAERDGAEAAARLGASSLADLRGLPADEIQGAIQSAGIVIDGRYIPEDLSVTFAEGRQNAVDMLIGSNKDEGTFFVRERVRAAEHASQARARFGDRADEFLAFYPAGSDEEAHESSLASFTEETAWLVHKIGAWHANAGNRTYAYYFSRVPPAPRPELGATHVADVAYVFEHIPGRPPWTDADLRLAEGMSTYWTRFARTGDPNAPGLPEWPEYSEGKSVLELGDTIELMQKSVPATEKLQFFDAAFEALLMN